MSFKDLDIDDEAMFANAAAASEDTGEKDMSYYTLEKKDEPAIEDAILRRKPVSKSEQTPVKVAEDLKKAKKEKETIAAVKSIEGKEPKEIEVVKPKQAEQFNHKQGITPNSVRKILEMSQVLGSYKADEREFVKRYFNSNESHDAEVIYAALTANPRELDALNKIVIAKNQSSADRAFYLMELNNEAIGDIFDQIQLLTDELGSSGTVTDKNKLKVCRAIEKVIADMPTEMFAYIHKLQEFTTKAITK